MNPRMQMTNPLSEWLKEECEKRNLSMRAASQYIGVSHGTLSRTALGLTPDLETLYLMAKWGKVSLGYLLNLMGYEVGDAGDKVDAIGRSVVNNPVIAEVVEIMNGFTPEDQRIILDHAKWKRDTKSLQQQPTPESAA